VQSWRGMTGQNEEGASELAAQAGAAHAEAEYSRVWALLQSLLKQREQDPKVMHNVAITDYALGGFKDPQKLLSVLERLRKRVEEAREKADASDSVGGDLMGDADPAILAYNTAVMLYQTKQYGSARAVLEEMFAKIEPVDEFLAFRACFLLLDVQILQRQVEKATEVLAYLERSYSLLTKVESSKENGSAESRDTSESAVGTISPTDWPNKRSTRRSPTDISPEEVRSALNLYKAKLALMARSSKSSKREIKTTLNACVQNTTGLFLKANNEYLRQNYRKAIKLLSNSCQKSERDPNVAALFFNNMGCIHHCMRRHAAAAFYFTRALQENSSLYSRADGQESVPLPQFSCDRRCELQYNRGLQLLLLGKAEKAFTCFQAALELLHRQPRMWLRLGETCIAVHIEKTKKHQLNECPAATRPTAIGHSTFGVAGSRKLLLPISQRPTSAALTDDTEEPPQQLSASSAVSEPTLSYAIKCLRNALTQSTEAQHAAGAQTYAALLAGAAQGSLSLLEEYVLQTHTVQRLAMLQLAWCSLSTDDYLSALSWTEQLLAMDALAANIKAHAHLYACDALCHLNRSAEAETHLRDALAHGEALGGVVSVYEASANDGNELEAVRNPYYDKTCAFLGTAKSSMASMYANLASVLVLRGDTRQARTFVHQALSLEPTCRSALTALVYLDLRDGRLEAALDVLKKQRLPTNYGQ